MSRNSEKVKRWRERTKLKMIAAMGGRCCICGYNEYFVSMELHHLDPKKKEMSFGSVISNPKAWSRIVKELRKCVLVCSNCHKGVHHKLVEVPLNAPRFNEEYVNVANDLESFVEADLMDNCPVCGKLKPIVYKTCSKGCAAKLSRKIDWEQINLEALQKKGLSDSAMGSIVGVSGSAVRKRINKLARNNKRKCPCCNGDFGFDHANQKYCSSKCVSLASRKCKHPSKSQLKRDISNCTWVAIGSKYGVSDNAVRKWARKYGLIS